MEPTTIITAGAWAWDKYGKSLTDKTAGAFKSRLERFGWRDAAEAYRAKIKKLYGTMQIMGMAEPVPLDDIFTDAYMLDKPTAFSRFDIKRLKQMSADPNAPPDAKRTNGLRLVMEKDRRVIVEKGGEIVENDRNLFILGKPGAGKTTFLKYIAVKAAEQLINKIPIFISLREWADSRADLLPFIIERFDICDFPAAQPFVEELLKSGSAIVLFDALDEVNQERGQRDRQTGAMNNFIEKYDQTQYLITCRIAATDYSFERFTYVEIADFTEKQIQTFVGNWFRNNEGEKDKETFERFLAEFSRDDNKGLRDLARTPLLLTLLCLAFSETLTFPRRRVEIYKEALDALLKKWDSSRRVRRDEVYRKLSLGHKENMLARIAAETFEKNEYFISRSELERYITDYVKNVPPHDTNEAVDGEAILKAVEAQHGIFVERARGVYSFSHLSFQEYFTAKYIVDNAAKGTLVRLVEEYCADRRWREVILLTTSLLPDASQFMMSFRRGVDELLGEDEKLRAVLTWANKKSASVQADSWLARPSFLFVELFYSGRNPNLMLSLELALDLALARDQSLALALARVRDYALALDFDLTRFLSHSLNLDLDRDFIHELGLNDLTKELAVLSISHESAAAAEWEVLADKLRVLMVKHKGSRHRWNMTGGREARLKSYLQATRLLQDCLELAFMPPEEKRAVLESLYLPPGRWDGVEG